MDVVAQSRRDVVEDGRAWVDIEMTLRVIAGDRKQNMRVRIDRATKLPHSINFQAIEGGEGTILFDYPNQGPSSIYALGAPESAKIVDRVPAGDLNRVLEGLKAGRTRFDDSRAIYDWGDGTNVKRVWRKGRKWRVERLIPGDRKWPAVPRDADYDWWKNHQAEYLFIVGAICDGERIYYYDPGRNIYDRNLKEVPAVKLTMTQAINPSDDPFLPWPDCFPEQLSYVNVWQPSDDREILLDAKPADGPPDTIRLRVRETRDSEPGRPDLYRLWLRPADGYVVVRSELSVFDATPKPKKLAFVDAMVMEGLARSPKGSWYPTLVRRKTSGSNAEQVWKYHLDFDVPMPDELFRPLK
jgi:hypothetical protein